MLDQWQLAADEAWTPVAPAMTFVYSQWTGRCVKSSDASTVLLISTRRKQITRMCMHVCEIIFISLSQRHKDRMVANGTT